MTEQEGFELKKPVIFENEFKEQEVSKFFVSHLGSAEVDGLVVGLHAREPANSEAARVLGRAFPSISKRELSRLYQGWRESWGSAELPHGLIDRVPYSKLLDAFQRLYESSEPRTDNLVRAIASDCDASWAIAEENRVTTDPNRPVLKPAQGLTLEDGTRILTGSPSLISRVPFHWLVDAVAENTVGIDDQGELKKPFLLLSIHGMDDGMDGKAREGQDIVIAGGSVRKKKPVRIIDPEVRKWFVETFMVKVKKEGVTVRNESGEGRRLLQVAVHTLGLKDARVYRYEGDQLIVEKKDPQGLRFAAALQGLEDFREGRNYNVSGFKVDKDGRVNKVEKEISVGAKGSNFQVIQAELTDERVRRDVVAQRGVEKIFSELLVEFSQGNYKDYKTQAVKLD